MVIFTDFFISSTCLSVCAPGMIDLTGGSCLDLQPGEICTVYCQGPNYFGDQLGAGCPATNLDPNKVINWFPPTCWCKEPVPPPAGYLLDPTPNTYRCAPGYYGRANYRCVVDTVTCEPIVTLTGCALLAPCAPPEVPVKKENSMFFEYISYESRKPADRLGVVSPCERSEN